MEPSLTGQVPPPYAEAIRPDTQHQESEALLHTVQKVMYHERSVRNCDPRHGERIKNFVLFVLAIDYGVATNTNLSARDYTHFAKMSTLFGDLQCISIEPASDDTKQRRQDIVAWLLENLSRPCVTIGLPQQFLIETIHRFFSYATPTTAYYSCIREVASSGLPKLAQMLYFDKHIVIPRVIDATQPDLRDQMLRQLDIVSKTYFESVDGVSSSVVTNSTRPNFQITYTLKKTNNAPQRQRQHRTGIRSFATKMRSKIFGASSGAHIEEKPGARRRQAPLGKLKSFETEEEKERGAGMVMSSVGATSMAAAMVITTCF